MMKPRLAGLSVLVVSLAASAHASIIPLIPLIDKAQSPPQFGGITVTGIGSGATNSWSIVVLLTVLSFIPSILLCMTPLLRLLIVFHFLRQALGVQTTPSNQTLIGLALILTVFIMQPVGQTIFKDAIQPLQENKIDATEALKRATPTIRTFMLRYVREKDVALFVELAKEPRPKDPADLSLRVIVPAYITSELSAGFQIGAVLFLPFLVIDMVVASITTSIGMMQLPPVIISTPLKLLIFVMVDGWHLLIGSLLRSF
jgi:flagellar biosynthetic protein FliP